MRRTLVGVISILAYVVAQTPMALVLAQTGPTGTDSTPPSIFHTPSDIPMELDEPFLVRAVVRDDVGVAHVRLFFRAEGAEAYRSVEMSPEEGGSFSATIPAHRRSDRAIEYFIQAEDSAGNIALRGGAFEPLRIADPSTVAPGEAAASRLAMQTPTTPEKPWYKKWWVWTIAGAVIIGAAAGGGGGGGGDDNAETSGTATITAPIP